MNNKLILLIGSVLGIGGVFVSSFVKTEVLFILFYAITFAAGIGIDYFPPLMCGWEWVPKRRGLVTGIIIGGYGFGALVYI